MGEDSFQLCAPAWFVFPIQICELFQIIDFTRYPFNWKTPLGYFVAFILQCAGALSLACTYGHFIYLIVASSWLFIVFANDITKDMVEFNKTALSSNGNRTELTGSIRDLMQIYSDAKG